MSVSGGKTKARQNPAEERHSRQVRRKCAVHQTSVGANEEIAIGDQSRRGAQGQDVNKRPAYADCRAQPQLPGRSASAFREPTRTNSGKGWPEGQVVINQRSTSGHLL